MLYIYFLDLGGFHFYAINQSHDEKWCIEARLMKTFACSYQLCRLYFVTGLHPTCFLSGMELVSPFRL